MGKQEYYEFIKSTKQFMDDNGVDALFEKSVLRAHIKQVKNILKEIEAANSNCPVSKIIDMWNDTCKECAGVIKSQWKTGSARDKALKTRYAEIMNYDGIENEEHALGFLQGFFNKVNSVDWYCGRNGSTFYANLGWCMEPSNFEKIMERKL